MQPDKDLILMPNSFIVAGGSAKADWCGSTQLGVAYSTPSPSITVMTVTGEIDYNTVEVFREHLGHALTVGPRLVVVDLSRLTFFSVSGLKAVLDAQALACRRRRVLRVVAGARCVDRLFEVCVPAHGLVLTDTISAACTPQPHTRRAVSSHRVLSA
ncbi:STAS domain-containing protein [Nocardia niigatensis]|uniref:STAS domain-containing protein n=1 Tax=Nocardia niigatensis TaxID=209249 RepID=UPI0002DC874F|nr:STAS domain-containing protein [Nocardia niigatensis]